MKWSVWVQPNKIIEEEFPDGWTRDEVFEAASNRYANKVTTVSPAPVGRSEGSNSNNYSSDSGDFDAGGIGALCVLVLGGWLLISFWPFFLIVGAIGLFAWVYKIVNEDDD